MITSRQEFFRLLLKGKTLVREDKVTGIKYFLSYNNESYIPFEFKFKRDGEEYERLSGHISIEEACEWLFDESINYNKWEVL